MIKYLFVPLALLSTSLLAQFKIEGSIENYSNKPVLVKLFNNGDAKILSNTTTDASGNFTTKVPVNYKGIVRIDLPSGQHVNILSDNENVKFKTTFGDQMQVNLQTLDGNAQKEYTNIQLITPLNELNSSVFPHIKNMYIPTDEFYQAIVKEEQRINTLNSGQNLQSDLVKYTVDLEQLTAKAKKGLTEVEANQILNHIEKDDEKLERSSYLSELVFAYINYQFSQNPNGMPESNLDKATTTLLDKGNIQTERGQNILSLIFNLVPENNFPEFYKKYKTQVNGLTCKVTDDLKNKVSGQSDLKVGQKVPDIKFASAVKGKKSLYDIKSNQKLVVFWASWCPACMKEMPYVKEFYTDFKAKGGEIIAISLDYDKSEFEKATKDFGWYNYTDLLRWDSPIAALYNVQSTPTLFLLDKDNKLVKILNHVNEINE